MDDLDWEQHCREFDEVVRAHRNRPLPEGVLEDHHRLLMARMRAQHAKLEKLVAANPHIDWRF